MGRVGRNRFRVIRSLLAGLLLALAPGRAVAVRPTLPPPPPEAPFPGAPGRWLRLPALGTVWRPDVPSSWAPFVDGRWSRDGERLVWKGSRGWEGDAAMRGRWTRVGTWGWVWRPNRTGETPMVAVVFFRVPGEEERIGWIPLGPNDDVGRVLRLSRKGALVRNVPLENVRPGSRPPAAASGALGAGAIERLRKIPKGSRLMPAADVLARLGDG